MYYAAGHQHDVRFCNDFVVLYRFLTRAERDRFVEERNFADSGRGNLRTEPVTRSKARRHFSGAFTMNDQHDRSDERDWMERDGVMFWSTDNIDDMQAGEIFPKKS